jgi:CRISPR type III-B/RAMP module-associated protein Cmr5
MPQTLDQRRAKHAYDAVQSFKNASAKLKDFQQIRNKYVIHAQKLPSRIIASGLGQALAFLVAKDYCPALLVSISDWVLKRVAPNVTQVNEQSLLLFVISSNSELARRCTDETLAYLRWLLRFVEAEDLKEKTA